MDITVHINSSLPHQREHGLWLSEGFKQIGCHCRVTDSIVMQSDVHIISGPHYAYQRWVGRENVIMIDRALYHEELSGQWHSMDWVSISKLLPGGKKAYKKGKGRKLPRYKQSRGDKSIFLNDYNGPKPYIETDIYRPHPDNEKSATSLDDDLMQCDRAYGFNSTALIKAALMGLETHTPDERCILNDQEWKKILPYADWHYSEIQSGEACIHLLSLLSQ